MGAVLERRWKIYLHSPSTNRFWKRGLGQKAVVTGRYKEKVFQERPPEYRYRLPGDPAVKPSTGSFKTVDKALRNLF